MFAKCPYSVAFLKKNVVSFSSRWHYRIVFNQKWHILVERFSRTFIEKFEKCAEVLISKVSLLLLPFYLNWVCSLCASVAGWKEATELWTWASLMRPWWIWREGWPRFWTSVCCPETCRPSSRTCCLKERSSTVPTVRYITRDGLVRSSFNLWTWWETQSTACSQCLPVSAMSHMSVIRLLSWLWVDDFSLQGLLEQRNELGIMYRHAYALTAVEKVNIPRQRRSQNAPQHFCFVELILHMDPGLE